MTGAGGVRRLASILAIAWLAGSPTSAQTGFRPIDVDSKPIESFNRAIAEVDFGVLEFRGGIVVSSADDAFGAFSGLDFTPGGEIVAVADTGLWFVARPVENGGRLVGLADTRLARMLDDHGHPIAGKRAGDAEGLRILASEDRLEALVSFEGDNGLRRFVAAPDLAHARSRAVRLPRAAATIRDNAGLEAVAVAPADGPFAGATAVIAERSLDRNGNHRGWILGGPRAGAFSLVRAGNFDVTDAAFLPGGDLLVLERSLSLLTGLGMRIRRIAAADLSPGATVDGRVLVEADMRHQIDNMEGMALRPDDHGETRITLISDDNKSPAQRTVLLEFALPADAVPTPRMRSDAGR